jgi:hypothetical protein
MTRKVNLFHYWDWKAIGITVAVLIGLTAFLLIIVFKDEMIRSYRLSRLDEETAGKIISIEEQESMRQTKYGNIGVIDHYIVWYDYEINGIIYTQRNWIDGNKKNDWLINKIKTNTDKTIRIKYDSNTPKKSMIILK